MSEPFVRLSSPEGQKTLLAELYDGLSNGLGDIHFQCDDGELHAHRHVLVSLSPLLASVITHTDACIVIPGKTKSQVQTFLSLIYLGEVSGNASKIDALRTITSMLDISTLLHQCQATKIWDNLESDKFPCFCGQVFFQRNKFRKHIKMCKV